MECYGLLPERTDDANLAATALFLREPECSRGPFSLTSA
jgi:hypothetical protein